MTEYALTIEMALAFGVIAIAIACFAFEWLAVELTALLVVGALLLIFTFMPIMDPNGFNQLDSEALLKGFADPALMTILALLVLGQGLFQSGALEGMANRLVILSRGRPKLVVGIAFATVMVVSAFLNNTPVVVIFIPIMSALAERLSRSASKVMMPLSFIAVLGGMTTLIGSSTNLLVAGSARKFGLDPIGFFDFLIPGLVLAGVGAVYVALILPRLLQDRSADTKDLIGSDGKQFIAQIEVGREHPLIGKAPVAGMFKALPDMTVRMIQRYEKAFVPPFDDVTVEPGDIVIVAATRKALESVLSTNPDVFGGVVKEAASIARLPDSSDEQGRQERIIAEVVIAPASRMIGRNLEQLSLRYQTGTIALGVQRRSRMYRTNMNDIRLEAGDVLLLLGKRANIQHLKANKDLLLLEWSQSELPSHELSFRAAAIFASVVFLSATGTLPIAVASVMGAAAMIAFGCLNVRQAARAVDRQIFLIVGAALAMGTALEVTGGAAYLAHGLVTALGGASHAVILSAFFLLVALLTNILSNNATAVLFTPIAIRLAHDLNIDPYIFVYAVIFAANCSFATPMAYQTNLLVMGPGHHTFRDFVIGGTPLIILIWLAFSIFAPWYYGLL